MILKMEKEQKGLVRLPVKYIRDYAKSGYPKKSSCEVCGSTENLDFHHFYSMTPLFDKWCKKNKIQIKTEEDILKARVDFVKDHHKEVYEDTVTICNTLHEKLHSIYGKNPNLGTAKKQMRWIEKQKEKQ